MTTKIKHEEIAEEFANYYELLYRKEEGEIKQIQMYLNNIKLPKITPEQKVMLEKSITVVEIYEHIQKLKTGTAPGDDGYTN
uniref:Uncharacterized protein n=1 Tax=Neogobius melanostomus TaxID=47308 RepID=A0A8C6TJE0_9GOBI